MGPGEVALLAGERPWSDHSRDIGFMGDLFLPARDCRKARRGGDHALMGARHDDERR